MTLYTRLCLGFFGVSVGIVVLFAIDMTLLSGRFAAHALHRKTPECSGSCHGTHPSQNASSSATLLALPCVSAAHRPDAATPEPWRDSLLGLRMETQGGR